MGKNSVKDNTPNGNSKTREGSSDENESVTCEKMKDIHKKKIRSSDALKEIMSPTSEELDYRREKSRGLNPVERYSKLFKCTKCQKYLKPSIEQNKKAPVHTCLGVLMCDKCRDYYEDGEFSLDSEGEDKYCRWCGEGGTIFTCSECICGFCANCIKRHFSLKFYKNVQKDDNWHCFFCDPKPLWFQRYICSLAIQLSQEADAFPQQTQEQPPISPLTVKEQEQPQTSPRLTVNEQKSDVSISNSRTKRKRTYSSSSSSDETDIEVSKSPLKKYKLTSNPLKSLIKDMEKESPKNVKSGVLFELQKLLKLSEYQMNFGVTWCHDTLQKISQSNYKLTQEGLLDECKKIKWFLSLLSTYLVQFCNSVDSIERSIHKDDGQKISGTAEKHQSPYITILQFLDFVSNQVKTFIQKDISFSDVLEASVYDDEKVIGLKKKGSLKNKKVDLKVTKLNLTVEDSESNESKEEIIEDNINKGEGSLEVESDQNNESSFLESGDSCTPRTTHKDNSIEGSDSAQDIQKLLSILENA